MNIKKQTLGGSTLLVISGVIDEQANFSSMVGPLSGPVEVNCKDVTKINSNGVKSWISYFTSLTSQGTKLSFSQLSPVLVEQLNSLSNFCVSAKVHSLMVPFACTKCHKETIIPMDIPTLKANPEPEPIVCPHCKGSAEFDDLPEEYFCCLETLD